MSNEPSTPTPIPPTPSGPPPGVPAIPSPKYPLQELTLAVINDRFEYHAPKDDQPARYALIRAKARELALVIAGNTPPSREQSLAHTHLDQVVMLANAAIARNE